MHDKFDNELRKEYALSKLRNILERQCHELSESFKFYEENAEILKDRIMYIRYEVKNPPIFFLY